MCRLRCSGRNEGLTLIEVSASLALLGTLLTSLIIAHGKHQRQLRLAEKRLIALDAADHLLRSWQANLEPVRHGMSGVIPGRPPLRWHVRGIVVEGAERIGAQVLRLELREEGAGGADVVAELDILSTEITAIAESVVP